MTQSILVHIVLMVLGVVVLLGAAYVGKTDRGGKKLNTHKIVGGIGVVLVLLGAAGLLATKALLPTLPHFWVALLAIVFMILTPIGGLLFVKAVPAKKAGLRKSHRFDAMIFFGLAAVVVVLGIISVLPMIR
ncbi:MAG: hypothetical protein NTX94_00670 [Caldiserica bacterium]|nr:hypothetical protein [Caldisericota bacterium]